MFYYRKLKYAHALMCLKQVADLQEQSDFGQSELADSYTNYALVYKAMGKEEIAGKYADKAISKLEELNDADKLLKAYEFRCSIGGEQHRLRIIECYRWASQLSIEAKMDIDITQSLIQKQQEWTQLHYDIQIQEVKKLKKKKPKNEHGSP